MPFELMMLLGFFGTVLLSLLPARPETQSKETAAPRPVVARKQDRCQAVEARRTSRPSPPWRAAA